MKIIKVLSNDSYIFLNSLLKELSMHNIRYLVIKYDDYYELHVNDKIYRLYEDLSYKIIGDIYNDIFNSNSLFLDNDEMSINYDDDKNTKMRKNTIKHVSKRKELKRLNNMYKVNNTKNIFNKRKIHYV